VSPPVEDESFRTSALCSVLGKHRRLNVVTFNSIYQKLYSVLDEIVLDNFLTFKTLIYEGTNGMKPLVIEFVA
jgi:hypothetical protein